MKNNTWIQTMALGAVTILAATASTAVGQVLNEAEAEGSSLSQEDLPKEPSFSEFTQVFGSWSVQCREGTDGPRCFVQTIIRQSNPQPREILVIRVSQRDDAVRADVVTPNLVKLDRGVALTVGEEVYEGQYRICGPASCSSSLDLEVDALEGFRSAEQMGVSFYVFSSKAEDGQRVVEVPVSLVGFSAAYDEMLASLEN